MLKKRLQGDLKEALKNKEKLKLDTVRLLIAALQYEEIQKKSESLPEEVSSAILQREVNKRREELEFADQSGRPELKDKLLAEISIIEAYLPKQLSSVELEKIITDLKLKDPALNLGVAMKTLKDNYSGQYDGKIASEVARKDLELSSKDIPTIAISGSSGFIGSALVTYFEKLNFRVIRLVRSIYKADNNLLYWDPINKKINLNRLENLRALISLGGENIAAKRWNSSFKENLEDSRINPTEFLADSISQLKNPPPLWLSASAVGFYGDTGALEVDESSPSGSGFLADLVTKWEEAAKLNSSSLTRVINLRFGLVLGKNGGPLSKMLLPFSFGLGAILGDGKNYMSWIAIDDLLRAVHYILNNHNISGAVNLTTPNPVTNFEFSKSLASALNRPCFLKLPPSALRILLGEIADEALLISQRVLPKKLLESGFNFLYANIDNALQAELAK